MKYQKGDKVVIREDLKVGKKYGNITWLEGMEPMKSMPFATIFGVGYKGSYVLDTVWAISEEMISHKYREKGEFNMKYQEGDKVVIRKDLELGKEYGKDGWVEGMKHLANEPYVTIEHKLSEGHYLVVDTVYRITDEMISHKYEEELSVWYCEDDKYFHVLCCDGSIFTINKASDNGDTLNNILEGHSDSFLLPLEEAKKSAIYPVLKCVEVKKPKMYYIRMGLGNLSYVNYDEEEGQYFLSSKIETEHERTMFTEEEANKIVGTDSILVKEEVE